MNEKFTNPILSGFYPDPSICRVGEDYYLVNSSFAYFPGVPIFHSKDLVHWQQIGHVLDRPSQLNTKKLAQSQGIYAPTIRYHEGTYYVITTNVGAGGNFIVTAKDPKGPWSDPMFLEGAEGIDPSLFFDDDGRAYYTGTRGGKDSKYYGDNEIWLQELDLKTMKLTGEIYSLWRGALKNSDWAEGPHLYKINGMYYLMIAEGGTAHNHSITIARSSELKSGYVGNLANPILTHRHLGKNYPIVNVGHGDLVETQNGEWWMVLLGSRPYGGYYRNLGRETFLVPVIWEDGWPVVCPGTGKVENVYSVPNLPQHEVEVLPERDNFDSNKLRMCWNFLRSPKMEDYSLTDNSGHLRMKLEKDAINTLEEVSFIGRRQQHINFTASTLMEFKPENNEEAGLVLYQNHQFNFVFTYKNVNGKKLICLKKYEKGEETIISEREVSLDKVVLKVEACGQEYSFYYGKDESEDICIASKVDGRILSTDVAGGFVGAYIGMYGSSNGIESKNYTDFDWFEYKGEN